MKPTPLPLSTASTPITVAHHTNSCTEPPFLIPPAQTLLQDTRQWEHWLRCTWTLQPYFCNTESLPLETDEPCTGHPCPPSLLLTQPSSSSPVSVCHPPFHQSVLADGWVSGVEMRMGWETLAVEAVPAAPGRLGFSPFLTLVLSPSSFPLLTPFFLLAHICRH